MRLLNMSKPVVLIMAGGKGERFWPRSREKCPKQLQKVYSDKTLLEETYFRAQKITDKNLIFIGCNASLKKAIIKTHKISPDNFIIEPEGRNTAPIIALFTLIIENRLPGRVHVILSADHFITPVTEFKKTINKAVQTAENGYLVTLGIKPSRPETGYGYIAAGKASGKRDFYDIKSFIEKPDLKKALSYIRKRNFFWNSGMFIWKSATIIEEFYAHAPDIICPIEDAYKSPARLKKTFKNIPRNPVDTAIMEKSGKVAMVPASFNWDDVGSWLSLERIAKSDKQGNIFLEKDKKSIIFQRDSSGNTVLSSNRPITMLGVKDLVIVDEGDLLFVSSKEEIAKIKELISDIRKNPALQKFLS